MQITHNRDAGTLTLSHAPYIRRLVDKAQKLCGRKLCARSVPLRPEIEKKLSKEGKPSFEDFNLDVYTPFRSILGEVAHVANWSRPDIAHAMSFVSQYMAYPQQKHLDACLEILEYLAGTAEKKLEFRKCREKRANPIMLLCDADLGGEKESCRSRTGFLA